MFNGKKNDVCWIPGKDAEDKFQPRKIIILEETPSGDGYVYSDWDRVGETLRLVKKTDCFATKNELVWHVLAEATASSLDKISDIQRSYEEEAANLRKYLEK